MKQVITSGVTRHNNLFLCATARSEFSRTTNSYVFVTGSIPIHKTLSSKDKCYENCLCSLGSQRLRKARNNSIAKSNMINCARDRVSWSARKYRRRNKDTSQSNESSPKNLPLHVFQRQLLRFHEDVLYLSFERSEGVFSDSGKYQNRSRSSLTCCMF